MSSLNTRRLLVRNWGEARYRYQQLLGKFLWQARARSGESTRAVVKNARDAGQTINTRLISEAESLRNADPTDEHTPRYQPSFWTIIYLVWHYGYSLAQFEDYLRTGAMRDATERERADAVTQAFLALPETDRAQVEDFIAYRHQQASARALDPDAPDDAPTPKRSAGQRAASANEMRRQDAARSLVYTAPED
jgi:hypothetical protein